MVPCGEAGATPGEDGGTHPGDASACGGERRHGDAQAVPLVREVRGRRRLGSRAGGCLDWRSAAH